MNLPDTTRRRYLLGAGAMLLSACDLPTQGSRAGPVLRGAEAMTLRTQRLLQGRGALAREYAEADIAPSFRVNGTSRPDSDAYAALLEDGFAHWRLQVDGLVAQPKQFRWRR